MLAVPETLSRLFSSSLRIKILHGLFSHPGESFHIARMAALLDDYPATVSRELSNLAEAGLLVSSQIGNQKHFVLASDSPILEELRRIFIKITGVGAELISALDGVDGLELAFLYGSEAKGTAGPGSDVDLMVVGSVSDRALSETIVTVELRLMREINFSLYTRGEVRARLGTEGDFVYEVFNGPRILLIGTGDDRLFQTDPQRPD